MLLKNKTAVISGCNKGIGKKILDIFSSSGADVIACVRNIDDDVLYKWYFNRDTKISVPLGNVAKKLKKFKF